MIMPLISIALIFGALCLSEILWRTKVIRGEAGRKFVHILVGTFVAFWPFYMSFRAIQLISLAMLAGIIISRRLKVFQAIHAVKRRSWGDILFALSIGLLAVITDSRWIFATAMLHMSVADGLAAVVGVRWGNRNRYRVFGRVKSVAGSLTFWVFSVVALSAAVVRSPADFNNVSFAAIVLLSVSATAIENLSPKGSDNLLVPLLVAAVLTGLR
jgi:phytol kinase